MSEDRQTPKFYTDVHIALVVVRQLQMRGVDIVHCSDVGMADVDDETHLNYAAKKERVMVSCDDDFVNLHWSWLQSAKMHSGIVYFKMRDQCKNVGLIVREINLLHSVADQITDLNNQLWRVES